jgi:ribonuclease P protein component
MVNRDLRLHEDRDIKLARREGKAYADGALVARIRSNLSDPPVNRYTVIASKKQGKAHERNRCKRLVREAMRRLDPYLTRGYDIAVILRGGVDELTGFEVAFGSFERIVRRARLLSGEVPPPYPRTVSVEPQPPADHPDAS